MYEFDQVLRFLDCKVYWDVPWYIETLAQLYCPVLFAVKVMLKKVQKTDVSSDYIKRVLKGSSSNGKKAMTLALRVAKEVAERKSIAYLLPGVDNTDILNTESDSRSDTFSSELYRFYQKNMSVLKVSHMMVNPSAVTRREKKLTFDVLYGVISSFIVKFWVNVESRLSYTDIDCNLTSFSEAPAESFFSKWAFITDHRPSLKPVNVVSLCRVMLDGPDPGTQDSHDLTKRATERWSSKYKTDRELFVTKTWDGKCVSNKVGQIQKGTWKFSSYSCDSD